MNQADSAQISNDVTPNTLPLTFYDGGVLFIVIGWTKSLTGRLCPVAVPHGQAGYPRVFEEPVSYRAPEHLLGKTADNPPADNPPADNADPRPDGTLRIGDQVHYGYDPGHIVQLRGNSALVDLGPIGQHWVSLSLLTVGGQ